jgi:hypothetical protein
MYIAVLFLFNLGAIWGGWLTPRPDRCTSGKETWHPLYRTLDGPQGRPGRVRKIWPSLGFDLRTVQPRSESLYRPSYPGALPSVSTGNFWRSFTTVCSSKTCSLLGGSDRQHQHRWSHSRYAEINVMRSNEEELQDKAGACVHHPWLSLDRESKFMDWSDVNISSNAVKFHNFKTSLQIWNVTLRRS